jgi:hypothetical protein
VRPPVRVALGLVLAAAFALALGALTRVPYTPAPGDEAELRLTWRARAAPAEECRRLTDAEREALPVHMRRDVVCEGRVAAYALEVVVDGVLTHKRVVEGAGARGDRPLYVYDALRLAPGYHDVHVVFERVSGSSSQEDRVGGVPDRLELRERIEVGAGDVVLVTYDAANRRLVVRGG